MTKLYQAATLERYCISPLSLSSRQFIFFSFKNILKFRASLMAQMVKNLPAMQDTWVRSLGGEDYLEGGMATHSGILA